MALDSTGDADFAPDYEGDLPARRPLGRKVRLAMVLAAIAVFALLGPVGAAEQLQHTIQHVFPEMGGGCGGG